MAIETPTVTSAGTIKEITLGTGATRITVGGEGALPFHAFEGALPHAPKIAMEVWDKRPEDWAEPLNVEFGDVYGDPIAWAKRCIGFGADAIMLTLASTDPNGDDATPESAAETVKRVALAIEHPLIVWGSDNEKKNADVLRKAAEAVDFRELVLGPAFEGNYKPIGAGAIGYKHKVVASSPIDVNIAKQLNILLGNLGLKDDFLLIDPTTGGLGYGLEYTYSVIERARLAALLQGDAKLQYPILCNVGKEVWKVKEVKTSTADQPTWGEQTQRGIAFECVTAVTLLLAGADLVVVRHPRSVKLLHDYLANLLG